MSSIKDEPTEGESSLNAHPSTFVNQSPTQSTVKCEWSLAGACVCADGQCEDCQASDGETDEKDDILTKTLVAAASPLNSPENDETEFHPPIWEDCEAAKETGNASDAESENVKQVLETIDGNLADGPVIEEVNTAEIKEEIPDIVEKGNANKESPMAVQVSSVSPPVQPDQELVGQAEDTALSFLSLRRSPRVPKRLVNYAVLPEAEEEDTGTSDSEESDSDHSEAEIQTETETDGYPSETEESFPIAASSDGHQSLSRQAFPCRYCGKRFARRQHVRRHEATLHHGIKISKSRPFLCPFPHCGSAFVSQSALARHRNIHSNLRPFTCATCDAAFNHASSLRAHQRTHSAARPYVCALCPKAFKLKHALLRHARLHAGSKPSFTCADCRLSFTQKSSLERHRRETLIHSGLKPFKCTVCGGAFTCRSTLKKHSRTFHSI